MEITIKIAGMSCGHCSARVKGALEKVTGVESAEVSHADGLAVIKGAGFDPAAIRQAIEDQGFDVVG